MSVKHRITINLERHEYEALQKIADGSERSLAWLGRKAICEFIIQKESRVNRSILHFTEDSKLKNRGSQ